MANARDPNPDLYRRYLQRDPNNVPMQVALANALLRLKQPRAAIEILVRALRLDPRDTNALDYLAVAEAVQGNHRRALEILKRAVAKNPDHALCWINLGITTSLSGTLMRPWRTMTKRSGCSPTPRTPGIAGTIFWISCGDDSFARLLSSALAVWVVASLLRYPAAQRRSDNERD